MVTDSPVLYFKPRPFNYSSIPNCSANNPTSARITTSHPAPIATHCLPPVSSAPFHSSFLLISNTITLLVDIYSLSSSLTLCRTSHQIFLHEDLSPFCGSLTNPGRTLTVCHRGVEEPSRWILTRSRGHLECWRQMQSKGQAQSRAKEGSQRSALE